MNAAADDDALIFTGGFMGNFIERHHNMICKSFLQDMYDRSCVRLGNENNKASTCGRNKESTKYVPCSVMKSEHCDSEPHKNVKLQFSVT